LSIPPFLPNAQTPPLTKTIPTEQAAIIGDKPIKVIASQSSYIWVDFLHLDNDLGNLTDVWVGEEPGVNPQYHQKNQLLSCITCLAPPLPEGKYILQHQVRGSSWRSRIPSTIKLEYISPPPTILPDPLMNADRFAMPWPIADAYAVERKQQQHQQSGFLFEMMKSTPEDGYTLLHHWVASGAVGAVLSLLKRENINDDETVCIKGMIEMQEPRCGDTPLHYACWYGQLEVAMAILEFVAVGNRKSLLETTNKKRICTCTFSWV